MKMEAEKTVKHETKISFHFSALAYLFVYPADLLEKKNPPRVFENIIMHFVNIN